MIITENDMAIARIMCGTGSDLRRYEKSTRSEVNAPKTRHDNTKYYAIGRNKYTIDELVNIAQFNITASGIRSRIRRGMTPEEAVTIKSYADWKATKKQQA